MRVLFVLGHPVDTPEAYWRCFLPARHLRAPAVIPERAAPEAADVLWVHQPTSLAAASLAERAAARGKTVIADLCEDPWAREECGRAYSSARLEALRRTLEVARVVVVASPGLLEVFADYPRVVLIEPVLPLWGWEPEDPEPALCWWSDGRQKTGWEEVAPAVVHLMRERLEIELRHVQFPHLAVLPKDLGGRCRAIVEGQDGVVAALPHFRRTLASAYLALECYPPGRYRDTVSDLGLLRAAAVGVPTVTTRDHAPPGALSVRPPQWAETILRLLEDAPQRERLAYQARAWAASRTGYGAYEALLQEV